ncbi:MAG: hypothetical protein AB7G75_03195 [Candidatus Binatia bacterium]
MKSTLTHCGTLSYGSVHSRLDEHNTRTSQHLVDDSSVGREGITGGYQQEEVQR